MFQIDQVVTTKDKKGVGTAHLRCTICVFVRTHV